MILNLIVLGLGVKLIVGAVQHAPRQPGQQKIDSLTGSA
jgi:hypothetical protein